MTDESPNKMTQVRHIRTRLAIYKTGRSPFWMVRLRDPFEGKYITRSSKETSRVSWPPMGTPPEWTEPARAIWDLNAE